MVDLKEMDRRGKVNSRIYRLMTIISIDDLEEFANDMEFKYEVKEAKVREIKGEVANEL